MVDAALAITRDDQHSRDGFRLFRSSWDDIQKHKDGLTLDAQGLSALTTAVAKLLPASDRKSGNKFWVDQTRRTHTETAAAYGIIAVPDADDNAHRLTGRRRDFAAVLDVQHWRVGLLVLCGAFYIFLGATALGLAGVLGILGAPRSGLSRASRPTRRASPTSFCSAVRCPSPQQRGGASSRR